MKNLEKENVGIPGELSLLQDQLSDYDQRGGTDISTNLSIASLAQGYTEVSKKQSKDQSEESSEAQSDIQVRGRNSTCIPSTFDQLSMDELSPEFGEVASKGLFEKKEDQLRRKQHELSIRWKQLENESNYQVLESASDQNVAFRHEIKTQVKEIVLDHFKLREQWLERREKSVETERRRLDEKRVLLRQEAAKIASLHESLKRNKGSVDNSEALVSKRLEEAESVKAELERSLRMAKRKEDENRQMKLEIQGLKTRILREKEDLVSQQQLFEDERKSALANLEKKKQIWENVRRNEKEELERLRLKLDESNERSESEFRKLQTRECRIASREKEMQSLKSLQIATREEKLRLNLAKKELESQAASLNHELRLFREEKGTINNMEDKVNALLSENMTLENKCKQLEIDKEKATALFRKQRSLEAKEGDLKRREIQVQMIESEINETKRIRAKLKDLCSQKEIEAQKAKNEFQVAEEAKKSALVLKEKFQLQLNNLKERETRVESSESQAVSIQKDREVLDQEKVKLEFLITGYKERERELQSELKRFQLQKHKLQEALKSKKMEQQRSFKRKLGSLTELEKKVKESRNKITDDKEAIDIENSKLEKEKMMLKMERKKLESIAVELNRRKQENDLDYSKKMKEVRMQSESLKEKEDNQQKQKKELAAQQQDLAKTKADFQIKLQLWKKEKRSLQLEVEEAMQAVSREKKKLSIERKESEQQSAEQKAKIREDGLLLSKEKEMQKIEMQTYEKEYLNAKSSVEDRARELDKREENLKSRELRVELEEKKLETLKSEYERLQEKYTQNKSLLEQRQSKLNVMERSLRVKEREVSELEVAMKKFNDQRELLRREKINSAEEKKELIALNSRLLESEKLVERAKRDIEKREQALKSVGRDVKMRETKIYRSQEALRKKQEALRKRELSVSGKEKHVAQKFKTIQAKELILKNRLSEMKNANTVNSTERKLSGRSDPETIKAYQLLHEQSLDKREVELLRSAEQIKAQALDVERQQQALLLKEAELSKLSKLRNAELDSRERNIEMKEEETNRTLEDASLASDQLEPTLTDASKSNGGNSINTVDVKCTAADCTAEKKEVQKSTEKPKADKIRNLVFDSPITESQSVEREETNALPRNSVKATVVAEQVRGSPSTGNKGITLTENGHLAIAEAMKNIELREKRLQRETKLYQLCMKLNQAAEKYRNRILYTYWKIWAKLRISDADEKRTRHEANNEKVLNVASSAVRELQTASPLLIARARQARERLALSIVQRENVDGLLNNKLIEPDARQNGPSERKILSQNGHDLRPLDVSHRTDAEMPNDADTKLNRTPKKRQSFDNQSFSENPGSDPKEIARINEEDEPTENTAAETWKLQRLEIEKAKTELTDFHDSIVSASKRIERFKKLMPEPVSTEFRNIVLTLEEKLKEFEDSTCRAQFRLDDVLGFFQGHLTETETDLTKVRSVQTCVPENRFSAFLEQIQSTKMVHLEMEEEFRVQLSRAHVTIMKAQKNILDMKPRTNESHTVTFRSTGKSGRVLGFQVPFQDDNEALLLEDDNPSADLLKTKNRIESSFKNLEESLRVREAILETGQAEELTSLSEDITFSGIKAYNSIFGTVGGKSSFVAPQGIKRATLPRQEDMLSNHFRSMVTTPVNNLSLTQNQEESANSDNSTTSTTQGDAPRVKRPSSEIDETLSSAPLFQDPDLSSELSLAESENLVQQSFDEETHSSEHNADVSMDDFSISRKDFTENSFHFKQGIVVGEPRELNESSSSVTENRPALTLKLQALTLDLALSTDEEEIKQLTAEIEKTERLLETVKEN